MSFGEVSLTKGMRSKKKIGMSINAERERIFFKDVKTKKMTSKQDEMMVELLKLEKEQAEKEKIVQLRGNRTKKSKDLVAVKRKMDECQGEFDSICEEIRKERKSSIEDMDLDDRYFSSTDE